MLLLCKTIGRNSDQVELDQNIQVSEKPASQEAGFFHVLRESFRPGAMPHMDQEVGDAFDVGTLKRQIDTRF